MKFFSFKRNAAHALALTFFASATLSITACSSSHGGYTSNNAASTPTTANANLWNNVSTSGYVSGGPWGNTQAVSINQANETITVQIPLPTVPGAQALSLPVSEIPGATVSLAQDPTSGQWYFEFTMPLSDLIKGITYQNPTTLPNGEALPAIPAGQLPSIAAHFTVGGGSSATTFYVYGSAQYFAIFLPTPSFNPYVALQYPIMNTANTEILGYFNTIPNTTSTTSNGGLYLALVFPQDLQTLLNTLF